MDRGALLSSVGSLCGKRRTALVHPTKTRALEFEQLPDFGFTDKDGEDEDAC